MTITVLLGTADGALAANNDLMQTANDKAVAVFKSVKQIIFVVGGFGLVALAFMAIFGKLDWKKFSMLAVGLAILAAAGAIVDYATESTINSDNKMGDTFGRSVGSGL